MKKARISGNGAPDDKSNLEEAQHISKIGNWEYFKETKVLNCSSETKKIFGLNSTNSVLKYDDFHLCVADQDWSDIDNKIKQAVRDRHSEVFS